MQLVAPRKYHLAQILCHQARVTKTGQWLLHEQAMSRSFPCKYELVQDMWGKVVIQTGSMGRIQETTGVGDGRRYIHGRFTLRTSYSGKGAREGTVYHEMF